MMILWLKRSIQIVVIVFVLAVIAGLSVLASERGTRFLLQQMLPKQVLVIDHVDGSLLSHLVLQGVHSDVLGLTAHRIDLLWQPQALLHWQLKCVHFQIDQLQLVVKPAAAQSHTSPPTLSALHWPWYWPSIVVQQVHLDHMAIVLSDQRRIALQQAQTAIHLNDESIAWSWQLRGLQIDQQDAWNMTGKVQGPWQNYQMATSVQGVKDPTLAWSIQAKGTPTQLLINHIQGKWLPHDADIILQGTWWPQLQIDAKVATQDLNLSQWWADWPSHLQLDLRFKALLDPTSWQVKYWQGQLKRLQGQVRQKAVIGQGQIEGTEQQWQVTQFTLQSGQAKLMADGLLGRQQTRFHWQVAIPDMVDIWPNATGSLISQGQLQGAASQFDLSVHTKIEQLHLADYQAKHALLDFAYRTTQPAVFSLQFTGKDWRWQNQDVSSLTITSQGQYAKQQIDWSIQSSLLRSKGRLLGGFDEHMGWRGMLQTLEIAPWSQALWRLRNSIPLVLSKDRISLPQALCMQQARQWLCARGEWQQDAWQFHVSSSPLDLMTASFLYPANWRISGQLQTQIDADGRANYLDHSRVRLNIDHLRLGVPHAKTMTNIDVGYINAAADTMPQAATASLSIQGAVGHWLAKARSLHWQGSLNDSARQSFDATLTGQLTDLAVARPFLPAMMNSLSGQLEAKATYQGTLAQHQAHVDVQLKQGSVNLLDYNIRIAPLTLRVMGDPMTQLNVTGRLQSGSGYINVTGLFGQLWTQPQVALTLKGQNFLATNLSTYQVTASPNLQYTYQANQMHLDGDLLIPKATLRFVDYQHKVVKLTSDVVYVDDHSTPLNFYSNMQVRLGRQVTIQYGGLKGRLQGEVTLDEQPNRLTQGRGEIRLVDGAYQAFGQVFSIRKALVQFNGGAVTNPIVDAEAVRRLTNVVPVDGNGNIMQNAVGIDSDLIVGVMLHGPLNTSQIKLFSQPAGLSQADILSYLLIGRPTSEATGSNAQLLVSAASLLSSSAGSGGAVTQLQQQLKNTLGLEVDVGATSQYSKETQSVNQNTSVILGKALSPRLFLNYSIGITQPVNVLRLTYRISRRWSAQTESSSLGNGGDLFYTINSY